MVGAKSKAAWAATLFYILSVCLLPLFISTAHAEEDERDLGTVIGIDLGTTYS